MSELKGMRRGKMDLTGTWKVTVTKGPLWFRALNLLGDKKIIDKDIGYNVAMSKYVDSSLLAFIKSRYPTLHNAVPLAKGIRWGEFGITKEGQDYILTYKLPIVDKVRWTDGKLAGEFYLRGKYVGDFEMVKQ